jgi:hypothetical protein
MEKLIQLRLSDGAVVFVQAEVGRIERDVSDKKQESQFAEVIPSIISLCKDFTIAMNEVSPDKAKLEFGISFRVETNGLVALIGKGSADTNVRITLEWSKESSHS